jgi:Domain of unknown function (DUF4386)
MIRHNSGPHAISRQIAMTERSIRISPQRYARICGVLYLYIIGAGIFAELFVRGRLVVSADAAATASNIMAHEALFRLGFSGELLHLAFDVAVAVILYALLKPVDRNIALLAAFMRFACDIILAVASLSHFAALRLFADADYLKTFRADQLNTLALLALKLHGDGYAISLVFFSFACLSLGYLIFRSGFLPRTIGALMAIAGVCYLVNSFSHFLAPVFAATLFPALFVPIFVAELSLTLWLIVRDVNVVKWEERASGAAS